MLEFSLLSSGSSGNATLISSGSAKILIDNGLSYKQLNERAARVGVSLEELSAVLITHEHSDHVNGCGVLQRKTGVPIYMTAATQRHLPLSVGKLDPVRTFEAGDRFEIGDLSIHSFSVAHDAVDPVSFTVESNGAKFGLATDLGHISHLVRQRLAHSHALVLESNYCPEMLRLGEYPAQVQQRIRGRLGHLSNQDMSSLLDDLMHDSLQTVVLVHISQNNNSPERAHLMAQGVLKDHPAQLYLSTRDEPTPLFRVLGSC
ncbi:MAG: MBL fold metallo-hydrolase [Candidatus Hydrogenedentes bacterium]|nr:MBL fold metallo-hydrolase [Candidatus Hydrogenedentota bacterium]